MIGSLRYMFYLETFVGKESLIILGDILCSIVEVSF
jgi:hypothetical protein